VSAEAIVRWHELLEKYPAEMAHDFRKIYGYSIFDVGNIVPWGEALAHLMVLKATPESLLYVALSDGEVTRPWSFFEVALYDIIDVLIASIPRGKGSKKPQPIPRPWKNNKKTIGKGSLPLKVGIEFFARLGHKPTIKTANDE
jgi:hypothetical protein